MPAPPGVTQESWHINCGQLTARVTGSHPHSYVGGAHLRMLAPALDHYFIIAFCVCLMHKKIFKKVKPEQFWGFGWRKEGFATLSVFFCRMFCENEKENAKRPKESKSLYCYYHT